MVGRRSFNDFTSSVMTHKFKIIGKKDRAILVILIELKVKMIFILSRKNSNSLRNKLKIY